MVLRFFFFWRDQTVLRKKKTFLQQFSQPEIGNHVNGRNIYIASQNRYDLLLETKSADERRTAGNS